MQNGISHRGVLFGWLFVCTCWRFTRHCVGIGSTWLGPHVRNFSLVPTNAGVPTLKNLCPTTRRPDLAKPVPISQPTPRTFPYIRLWGGDRSRSPQVSDGLPVKQSARQTAKPNEHGGFPGHNIICRLSSGRGGRDDPILQG